LRISKIAFNAASNRFTVSSFRVFRKGWYNAAEKILTWIVELALAFFKADSAYVGCRYERGVSSGFPS